MSMKKSKVSIIVPVYNSASRMLYGDKHLIASIASAVKQTHKNLEVLILDNQSTDTTPEICSKFAELDSRVHFYVDNERRSIEEGYNKLAQLVTGDWVVHLNDDDIFKPEYLETMLNAASPGDDFLYPNGNYITNEQKIQSTLLLPDHHEYTGPPAMDFCKAVQQRHVIPLMYGPVKTSVYKKLRPMKPFDQLEANMDNLFLAKFFLGKYKAKFVNVPLVFYRKRERDLRLDALSYMPKKPTEVLLFYLKHQLQFYQTVYDFIEQSSFSSQQKVLLAAVTLDSCIHYSLRLVGWVHHDIAHTDAEKELIASTLQSLKGMKPYMLSTFYPALSPALISNLQILSQAFVEMTNKLGELTDTLLHTDIEELLFRRFPNYN